MIPKHKLSGLLLALAPKKGDKHEADEHDDYDGDLDKVVDELAQAIVDGDKDAITSALHGFHDCLVEADEKQDSAAEEEE